MQIEQFDHDAHTGILKEWLKAHDMDVEENIQELPYLGFIAHSDNDYICAGFLRRTEGHSALLDSLITNPSQPGELRSEAIDLVVKELFKTARELKLKRLIAYSLDKNTLMRSEKHGFKRSPHTVIIADLSSGKED